MAALNRKEIFRMDGLTPVTELAKLNEAFNRIYKALLKDGYEIDEVKAYLQTRLNIVTCSIREQNKEDSNVRS